MTSHPHFDDGGTLEWHTTWADALAAARERNRFVLIEFGREQCSNCRSLVSAVLPSPAVAPLMKEHFVGLASDCDAPEPPVIELIGTHLADAMMLPFVMIVDADGQYLAGSSGAMEPSVLQKTAETLIAEKD